jgi:hypothetical protein
MFPVYLPPAPVPDAPFVLDTSVEVFDGFFTAQAGEKGQPQQGS